MTGLGRARELAAELGQWATSGDGGTGPGIIRAAIMAEQLYDELAHPRLRAESQQLWSLPGHPFARTWGGRLHTRDCYYMTWAVDSGRAADLGYEPLTRAEAEAYLRRSHDYRRCKVCAPDIPEAPWVRVRSPGGQVRWRLADDLELP